jgi:NAD(P)-dependent dehydrogenase (short-subunit alcohol dehydrogenase family)
MKKVLITGGSGGIASGIAGVLKSSNYTFLLPTRAELNVLSTESIYNFFKKFGPFDVVINNAGEIYISDTGSSDTWLWENVVNVNLFGTYRVAKEAIRQRNNATIINISSMSAYQYFKGFSAYASSKAGVVALTKCLAAEGTNAYSICPGSVDTKFREKILESSKGEEKKTRAIRDNDMLMPSDIGEIVFDILNNKYKSGSSILIRKNDIFEVR